MSKEMSESEISALKETLCAQQQLLQKLYNDLDVEREASSTAASEALSMILRLQGEKAAVKMEACQYKRMAEEKMSHVEESLETFEDLIYQRELEIASLDYQVQAYRYKLLSLGVSDTGVGEIKFPENMLNRNENIVGDVVVGLQSSMRRNSMPVFPDKNSYLKKGTAADRERSSSPDLVHKDGVEEEGSNWDLSIQSSDSERKTENSGIGSIESYWEQIKKLDKQVRDITDHKEVKIARGGSIPISSIKKVKAKGLKLLRKNEDDEDAACSSSVLDVFEVPQTQEKGDEKQPAPRDRRRKLNVEDKAEGYPKKAAGLKPQLSANLDNYLSRTNGGGVAVDCHYVRVPPVKGVSEFQSKFQQLNRTSEIVEVERQHVRDAFKREEEVKLLKEIREQLNSLHSELRSWKPQKSSKPDEISLCPLQEAMLYFWL